MSNRQDKEREAELQPKRMEYALKEIEDRGLEITLRDETRIHFIYNGNTIVLFPYSGWHQGKGIVAGRGLAKLLKQIEPK